MVETGRVALPLEFRAGAPPFLTLEAVAPLTPEKFPTVPFFVVADGRTNVTAAIGFGCAFVFEDAGGRDDAPAVDFLENPAAPPSKVRDEDDESASETIDEAEGLRKLSVSDDDAADDDARVLLFPAVFRATEDGTLLGAFKVDFISKQAKALSNDKLRRNLQY